MRVVCSSSIQSLPSGGLRGAQTAGAKEQESKRRHVSRRYVNERGIPMLRAINNGGNAVKYSRAVMSLDTNIPGMKSTWLDALPDDAERF